MRFFQKEPDFAYRLNYIPETDVVEIILKIGFLPPVALGLTPESFLEFADKVVNNTGPFLEQLKKMRDSGDRKELKAELNAEELDKLIELKKRLEKEHDKTD